MNSLASVARVDAAGLPGALGDLRLGERSRPDPELVIVELSADTDDETLRAAADAAAQAHALVVGVSHGRLGPRFAALGTALCTTVVAEGLEEALWEAGVPDIGAALDCIVGTVARSPVAARTLAGLLRITATTTVREGLVAESLAYSMLLAGHEFARWRGSYPIRPIPRTAAPAVALRRSPGSGGDTLRVTLNRPERHNAFGREVRDELAAAFDLVALDPGITSVLLDGNGPSFCSGGDLDEFGSSRDLPLAHLIRVDRSVAARIARVRDRVTVKLHGAAIGAGIELASHGVQIIAAPDTQVLLPELAMGLVPGAGGSVGITRRVGRWRTAFLALTGAPLPLHAAVRWGLVDAIEPDGDR